MGFDINKIKLIPLIDIAIKLGINVKNKKSLCFKGHDKNTKSLTFDLKKGLFHCFGCGIGGDSIKLVMEFKNLDFKNACKWINNEFNISNTNKITYKKVVVKKQIIEDKRFKPNPVIYEYLISQLGLSSQAYKYLNEVRGFSHKIIQDLKIKDLSNPDILLNKLLARFKQNELIECGIAHINNYGNLKLTWWDHSIIFPFFNATCRIDYLQARRLSGDEPKYINLKGVKPSIYNLNLLSKIKIKDNIFICEGITDTISAIQNNLNAVGILGANGFKEEWIGYFIDYTINIIPDSDKAGLIFAKKVTNYFESVGKPVRIITLPKYKDLNEYYRKQNSHN